MKPHEIEIFTTPSHWVNAEKGSLASPYSRIVGISKANDEPIIWASIDSSRPETDYDQQSTEARVLKLNPELIERLGSFFCRFFVEPPKMRSYSFEGREKSVRAETYNCHSFGFWMTYGPLKDCRFTPEPEEIVNYGIPANGNLELGQRAVLLDMWRDPLHSVIGLGNESDECLEVVATEGFLAIDSYKDIIDSYKGIQDEQMQFFVLPNRS